MHAWHLWIIAGIIFVIIDMLLASFFIVCFGIGSIITAFIAFLGGGIVFQLLTFVVVTFISLFTLRPVFLKYFDKQDDGLKTNVDAIIGATGIVKEEIVNDENKGRVKIGGELWKAESENNENIGVGQKVKILSISGPKVTVRLEK